MADVKSVSVSFGFKKKVEKSKADDKRAFNEQQEVADEKELVSETDQKFFTEKKKKKEIVIPLIKKNRWLKPEEIDNEEEEDKSKTTGDDSSSKESAVVVDKSKLTLDEAAALAVIEDSKRFLNEATNDPENQEFENLSVPLLLKNKPPEGFESDDKLDVSLRPDQASEADYEQIPIQAFGMAMLRGMGWSEKEGIGKTFKKHTKMVEAQLRPKGLGLGAENPKKQMKAGSKKDAAPVEELAIRVGGYVLVCAGQHEKKYGKVEGMDADNAQCIVKFALGGSTAYISELVLQAVSKDDYMKYGKDLSRFSKAYDDRKEKEDLKRKANGHHRHDNDEKRRKSSPDAHDDSRTSSRNGHKHHKSKTSSKSRDRDSSRNRDSNKSQSSSKRRPPWIRRNLRVRIVDKHYRKGKYFRDKVVIEDVLDRRGSCSCRTESGKILDDLNETMLETVIPKSGADGYVMITSHGKVEHDGKIARILEKDKAKSRAFLQLIEDRDVVVDLSFDDICEYTGDVENYSMF